MSNLSLKNESSIGILVAQVLLALRISGKNVPEEGEE